jgi:hypothetical protein
MNQLLKVNKEIWASVKHYATLNETNVNDAVEQLLKIAIKNLKTDSIEGGHDKNARA